MSLLPLEGYTHNMYCSYLCNLKEQKRKAKFINFAFNSYGRAKNIFV